MQPVCDHAPKQLAQQHEHCRLVVMTVLAAELYDRELVLCCIAQP
jgi:hypothetical protein